MAGSNFIDFIRMILLSIASSVECSASSSQTISIRLSPSGELGFKGDFHNVKFILSDVGQSSEFSNSSIDNFLSLYSIFNDNIKRNIINEYIYIVHEQQSLRV